MLQGISTVVVKCPLGMGLSIPKQGPLKLAYTFAISALAAAAYPLQLT